MYVDPTPAQAQALALALGGGGGGKRGAKAKVQAQAQVQVQVPMDQRNWDAKAAVDALYQAMEKYRKVDVSSTVTVHARSQDFGADADNLYRRSRARSDRGSTVQYSTVHVRYFCMTGEPPPPPLVVAWWRGLFRPCVYRGH